MPVHFIEAINYEFIVKYYEPYAIINFILHGLKILIKNEIELRKEKRTKL